MAAALPKPVEDDSAASLPPLTSSQFDRVSQLVFRLAGIVLKEHKKQMIYARLMRRVRSLELGDFDSYLDLVEGPRADEELEHFINAVTTNLTSFFREKHHFEHLEREILSPLATRGAKRVRIWSAGCSTGEEPYSIAMTVKGLSGHSPAWDLRILATDLDTNVLAHAAAGSYRNDRVEDLPSNLRKYVADQGGETAMRDELRKMISFRQLNLLESWPLKGPFDAIFCRNVMIYFEADTKAKLVERFANLLTPEGVLYLGHSESLLGDHPLLTKDGQTTYRRKTK